MKTDHNNCLKYKNKYRIPSTRLRNWDYSSAGYYFVTICTKNREPYLGKIVNNNMQLSKIGQIINKYWLEIPNHFLFVTLDKFVVMPNHIHGIIKINHHKHHPVETPNLGVSTKTKTNLGVSTKTDFYTSVNAHKINLWGNDCLGIIVNQFKRICTIKILKNGYLFAWQARYYDHIIKNEKSYWAIRKYIEENPVKWEIDDQNPFVSTFPIKLFLGQFPNLNRHKI